MSDYKTRKEAETAMLVSVHKQCLKFCPLIVGTCRKDCECFYSGIICEPRGGVEPVFRLTPATCSNAMFSGEWRLL